MSDAAFEMNVPETTPEPLRGVFCFLDALLKPEVREALRTQVVHKDLPDFLARGSCTAVVHELVRDAFMRADTRSPVCALLEEDFRLFHETDRAAAVTWAYALHLQGQDVLQALRANYAFNWKGILTEELSPDQSMSFTRHDMPAWRRFVLNSDVWAKCECYGYDSLVVLRGDRLLCEKTIARYNYGSHNSSWDLAWDRYEAQGGHRAFFAGRMNRLTQGDAETRR